MAHLSGTDHAKAVASVQAERDELRAKVTKIEQERDAQHVELAISSALSKSGLIPDFQQDAANLMRGVFTVKDGKVVTKDGVPNVIPGMDPAQLFQATVKTLRPHWFVVSQLRTMRPHYWPTSVGGGARGANGRADASADTSCFDPKHANYNLTAQGAYLRTHGREAFDRARARFGGGK